MIRKRGATADGRAQLAVHVESQLLRRELPDDAEETTGRKGDGTRLLHPSLTGGADTDIQIGGGHGQGGAGTAQEQVVKDPDRGPGADDILDGGKRVEELLFLQDELHGVGIR